MRKPDASAPIVLAAGGTGGHIFPAEALARELVARGRAVALITDRRGQSFGDRVAGVATHRIRAGRFDAGLIGKALGIAELLLGTAQAGIKLRALAPAAVVGFGGYPSVPTVIAAGAARRADASSTSRTRCSAAPTGCSPRASGASPSPSPRPGASSRPSRLAPSPPATRCGRPSPRCADSAYVVPAQAGAIELLVLGGSQGARIFSEIVPDGDRAAARKPCAAA